MADIYIAHIDKENRIQTVKDHCVSTAKLAADYSIPELKSLCYCAGLLHDIGKYQDSFQRRIRGESIQVEHSLCGAIETENYWKKGIIEYVSSMIIELCIMGHHGGIPDVGYSNDTQDMSTLMGRMKRITEDYQEYKEDLSVDSVSDKPLMNMIKNNGITDNSVVGFIAFITRYVYSCLTDADSIDTSDFCNGERNEELKSDFSECLTLINRKLSGFTCTTELQKARSRVQQCVFSKVNVDSDVYLMNMPTGSGKTLCSMKFALERAIRTNKRRIIYVIPFNSIIDQTVEEFQNMFGDKAKILRHQSSFSYDNSTSEDYAHLLKIATEDWNAQIIVTTAVQFFESLYSNRRSKLRKLHNMADSILVFDEAHMLPLKYMQPCLEGISFVTKCLNSEAIMLTATMPNYNILFETYGNKNSGIVSLVDYYEDFKKFEKCEYKNLGIVSYDMLMMRIIEQPSSLIVVNSKHKAVELFSRLSLTGVMVYHLSTYMTGFDRMRTIKQIRDKLIQLESDYPDLTGVPNERRIVVVSTSLIEAGVDLDFYTVYRELAGVDNIIQAGGRCNREGKRSDAITYIFEFEDDAYKPKNDDCRSEITKGLLNEYSSITDANCITEYYRRTYVVRKDELISNALFKMCNNPRSIPFKTYSDEFSLIDSNNQSVFIAQDQESEMLLNQLKKGEGVLLRKLQKYTVSVTQKELTELIRLNAVKVYCDNVFCLTNNVYYNNKTGIVFEVADPII